MWKKIDVIGVPCEINEYGTVREKISISKGVIYKNKVVPAVRCGKGFFAITRVENDARKNYYIHILTAKAFVPNPENLPVVKFKDGNKLNTHYKNLKWVKYPGRTNATS